MSGRMVADLDPERGVVMGGEATLSPQLAEGARLGHRPAHLSLAITFINTTKPTDWANRWSPPGPISAPHRGPAAAMVGDGVDGGLWPPKRLRTALPGYRRPIYSG